jgi:hypothetical protein
MLCFAILLLLYHSLFLFLFPQVPQSSSTITNTFYIWVCIWSCLFLYICLSFGSIEEFFWKTTHYMKNKNNSLYLAKDMLHFHPLQIYGYQVFTLFYEPKVLLNTHCKWKTTIRLRNKWCGFNLQCCQLFGLKQII